MEPWHCMCPTCEENIYTGVDSYRRDCSVGTIRKYRNEVDNDDGTCGTCPYYFDHYPTEDEI